MDPEAILSFWFRDPSRWFSPDPAFDDEVRAWYADVVKAVALGDHLDLQESRRGRLARVILLDQFPRNMWRGTPEAFAYDHLALLAADDALSKGDEAKSSYQERHFLYMPFMHAEDPALQDRSVALFEKLASDEPNPMTANALDYARRHRDVVARFGRFPHRNAILGRESTAQELEFLAGPNSSF
jgi:uncharacterized protein (DUF924 family)